MTEYTIKVHEIAVDGLPDKEDRALLGRIAFIADGCVVSGWPISPGEYASVDKEIGDLPYVWEANSDVGHGRLHGSITHWIEFPVPGWEMENSGSARRGMQLRGW